MRIRITKGGIHDGEGKEVPVGTVIEVADFAVDEDGEPTEPHPWAGRFVAITDSGKDKKPATGLKAEHHGGGKFKITQGEETLLSDLSKADADAFNALSDEDKAAFVSDQKKA